jgi:hypothetical protein
MGKIERAADMAQQNSAGKGVDENSVGGFIAAFSCREASLSRLPDVSAGSISLWVIFTVQFYGSQENKDQASGAV